MIHVNNSWEVPRGTAAAFAQVGGGFDCYPTWAEVPPALRPQPGSSFPQEVTMRQARLALNAAGKLAAVQTAIASMAEPQKTNTQIWWEYSGTVQRGQPIVGALGAAIGLTPGDVDNLFAIAATL